MMWKYNFVVISLFLVSSDALYRESKIVFENNGYSNVLLAIHESVTDESIIDKIKDTFTKASSVLHKATKKRAYFKEIVILIPNSWKDVPGVSHAAAGQTLQYADIVVSGPRPTHRNYPFTTAYAGCGHYGIHMQMTSDVFLKPSLPPVKTYPEKFIVHEWGTFRWGVFNEYPDDGENQFYFSTVFGRPDPVRCSVGLLGRIMARYPNHTTAVCNPSNPKFQDPATGLLDPYCKYYMYPYHNRGFESMMDHQWAKEITAFCDDRHDYKLNKYGHNFEPPNLHNRLCGHRSTYSVIAETDDFRNGKNQPRNISDLTPTFRIVKAVRTKRATVYVEDDSLESNQLTDHVLAVFNPDADVDIMHLNHRTGQHLAYRAAHVHSRKGKIRAKRQTVKSNTNDTLFRKATRTNSNDHFIVIKGKNVMNSTVTYPKHPSLHLLGNKGSSNQEGIRAPTIFEASHLINDGQGPIYLYHKTTSLKKGETFQDTFVIDELIDGDVVSHVCYQSKHAPKMLLTAPSGRTVQHISGDRDQIIRCTRTMLVSYETGKWTITVTEDQDLLDEISVKIFSYSSNSGSGIKMSAKAIQRMYQGENRLLVFAEVSHGHHPVVGLRIVARTHDDDGHEVVTELLDNGSGADLHKDDGIYSRYLPYHRSNRSIPILIEARDSLTKAYVVNTSISFEDGDTEDKLTTKRTTINIDLQHGLNRVTEIASPFMSIETPPANLSETIPPARVHDLRSHGMDEKTIITLTFTAVGDDLDHGTAEHYQLVYAVTGKEILDRRSSLSSLPTVPQSAILEGDLSQPLSSGYVEVFKIDSAKLIPSKSSFAFVVIAVDKDGNHGDMSNLVTAGQTVN